MFYLSFKFKRHVFPEEVWCDGVEHLVITQIDSHSFNIQGKITIATCVTDLWDDYPLSGAFTFTDDFKTIKECSYRMISNNLDIVVNS